MNYIDAAVNFFTSKNSVVVKIFIAIGAIFMLLIVNDIFGFTYYWNIEKKLNQIEKINTLLKDTTLKSPSRDYINSLQLEVLERKNVQYYIEIFVENISLNDIKNKIKNISLSSSSVKRNFFLQYISSAWIELMFLFILTVTVPSMVQRREEDGDNGTDILIKYFLAALGLLLIGLIHTILFSFLPVPFNWSLLSYVMNFLINLGLIIGVNKIGDIFPRESPEK